MKNQSIKNNYIDLEQRYIELLREHDRLMNHDEICPDCMYTQLLSNTANSIDLLDDLQNEIENDPLSDESEAELINDYMVMDEVCNKKKKSKRKKKSKKIIIQFE
jgi:hypothetical protein